MPSDIFELDPGAMIAEGGERMVFVHPDDPSRLIKVGKPRDASEFPRLTFGHLTQRFIPKARWRSTVKQYDEYNRLMLGRLFDVNYTVPVSHLYGFVKTNLGLGCISERVTDANGENAPTLKQMLKEGRFGQDDLIRLNAFVRSLYDVSVCVCDVWADNFVYGYRRCGPAGRISQPEWVLVDGFGDRFAVTIRSVSRRVRRLGLDDCFKRKYPKNRSVYGLRWNPAIRSFEFTAETTPKDGAQKPELPPLTSAPLSP